MAEQWGGKRTPRNPAPVSGPGQLSQRTDGGPQQVQADMSGMPYGENQEFATLQSSAPMSASPSAASPRARQRQAAQAPSPVPLFAPTQRPDEPVTAGAPFGPGDMGEPQISRGLSDAFRMMAMNQDATDAQDLMEIAQRLGW